MPRTCLICRGTEHRVIFREFGIDVYCCRTCGHVFSSYELDPHYDAYFRNEPTDWDDPFWWNQAHEAMYSDFGRRFLAGRSGRLLDVGCGLGFFVKKAGEYPGWDALGYEISPEGARYARETLGLDSVHCGRVEDSGFAAGSFDLVTLWDVIEHIPDPDSLLGYLAGLLAPGGLLFLHTPNIVFQLPKARIKRWLKGERQELHYLEAKNHLHLYSMKTLKELLRRNGLAEVEYVHLRPIQSIAGSRGTLSRVVKNGWYQGARAVFHLSGGRLNVANLFAVAQRSARGATVAPLGTGQHGSTA